MFPVVLVFSDLAMASSPWKQIAKKKAVLWILFVGLLLLWLEWRYLIVGSALGTGENYYFQDRGFWISKLTMARFVVYHYLWPLLTGLNLRVDFARPSFATLGSPTNPRSDE